MPVSSTATVTPLPVKPETVDVIEMNQRHGLAQLRLHGMIDANVRHGAVVEQAQHPVYRGVSRQCVQCGVPAAHIEVPRRQAVENHLSRGTDGAARVGLARCRVACLVDREREDHPCARLRRERFDDLRLNDTQLSMRARTSSGTPPRCTAAAA